MTIDWQSILDKVQLFIAQYGLRIVGALLILVLGRVAAGIMAAIVRKTVARGRGGKTLAAFTGSITYFAIIAIVVVAALNKLGVETTSFVAILGAAGLAVGLALQGSLSNFASGVLLVVFRPFQVGDFIEVGGVGGVVEEIQIFVTQLVTPDNKLLVVPNSKITSDVIVNYTSKDTRRVDLVFGIAYDDDIRKARDIIQKVLSQDERVLAEPAPMIVVSELGDSSVNFAVRPFVKKEHYWDVKFSLTEAVKLAFDEADITIPFPQRDVHIFPTQDAK